MPKNILGSQQERRVVLIALFLAVLYWIVALYAKSTGVATVWYDQENTFSQLGKHIADPYQVAGFVYPPWTALLLAPFSFIPLTIGVLIQICIYFVTIALIVLKFGGKLSAVIMALLSFFALRAVLELNIDYLVCLGLLVSAAYSGPLLFIKLQVGTGYWIGLKWKQLVRGMIVLLTVVLVALILWPSWPLKMIDAVQVYTVAHGMVNTNNVAPLLILPWFVSIAIGLALAIAAYVKRDPVIGVWAWLFFVPYITIYSLLLPYALLCARYRRAAAIIFAATWLVYGTVLGIGFVMLTR